MTIKRHSAAVLALLAGLLLPGWSHAQTLAPLAKYTLLDNTGKIINGGKLCTYLAGTTTPATTYADTSGTPNANPVIADSAGRMTVYLAGGTNYKMVARTAGTDTTCATGTVLWTQDNVAGVPSASGVVDIVITAGENLTINQVIYVSDGSGGKTQGLAYRADNANGYSSLAPIVGIAQATIASGSTGAIRSAGSLSGQSGLVIGTDYYIGTTGAFTSTRPSTNARLIGRADSTTSILVAPGQAAGLGASMVLLKSGSGSSTAAGATNVDTVSLSGLSTEDRLVVEITYESVTQQTAGLMLYSVTDSTQVGYAFGNGAIAAGAGGSETIHLGLRQNSTTAIHTYNAGGSFANGNLFISGPFNLTTVWTGSWTLALRHTGVTAGGTFRYRWAVYRVLAQ